MSTFIIAPSNLVGFQAAFSCLQHLRKSNSSVTLGDLLRYTQNEVFYFIKDSNRDNVVAVEYLTRLLNESVPVNHVYVTNMDNRTSLQALCDVCFLPTPQSSQYQHLLNYQKKLMHTLWKCKRRMNTKDSTIECDPRMQTRNEVSSFQSNEQIQNNTLKPRKRSRSWLSAIDGYMNERQRIEHRVSNITSHAISAYRTQWSDTASQIYDKTNWFVYNPNVSNRKVCVRQLDSDDLSAFPMSSGIQVHTGIVQTCIPCSPNQKRHLSIDEQSDRLISEIVLVGCIDMHNRDIPDLESSFLAIRAVWFWRELVAAHALISTLGGGHFLCKHIGMARSLAARQMFVAKLLGDEKLAARARVHLIYNDIMEGKFDNGKATIAGLWRFARQHKDEGLKSMIRAASQYLLRVESLHCAGVLGSNLKRAIESDHPLLVPRQGSLTSTESHASEKNKKDSSPIVSSKFESKSIEHTKRRSSARYSNDSSTNDYIQLSDDFYRQRIVSA